MTDKSTNIYSLQSKRVQSSLRTRRGMMTDAERIAALEEDVDKLVTTVLSQQKSIEDMDDRQWKLLRLIGKRLGIRK